MPTGLLVVMVAGGPVGKGGSTPVAVGGTTSSPPVGTGTAVVSTADSGAVGAGTSGTVTSVEMVLMVLLSEMVTPSVTQGSVTTVVITMVV